MFRPFFLKKRGRAVFVFRGHCEEIKKRRECIFLSLKKRGSDLFKGEGQNRGFLIFLYVFLHDPLPLKVAHACVFIALLLHQWKRLGL